MGGRNYLEFIGIRQAQRLKAKYVRNFPWTWSQGNLIANILSFKAILRYTLREATEFLKIPLFF